MRICNSCFKKFDEEFDICPYCGALYTEEPLEPIHLIPGTVLMGRYLIGIAEGSGGFGIIYRAWDLKLESIVAIKEFFSSRLMTRAEGTETVIINKKSKTEFEYRKARFLAEARNMAKFSSHRSIPNVFEFFEANGTAYIVMELLSGIALNDYLSENGGKIDRDFALLITNEVGNALCSLHEQKIIHRDVAPDNIYITSGNDIKVKLLDLGAAKLSDGNENVTDIILKPGYSPPEQYDNSKNAGPWNDIYALGATLYVMLTGIKPDESTNRKIKDTVLPPHQIDETISENLSNAVMKAMAVEKHMRFKSVPEFLQAVNGDRKVISLAKEKKKRKRRRISGISVACVVLVIASIFVYNSYNSKRLEEELDSATIEIWYSADEGSSEVEAMESVEKDFESKFTKVEINLVRLDPDEYQNRLIEAAQNDSLPALFESTDLSDESVLLKTRDVDNVLNSDQGKNCYFLNQYNNYYTEHKKLPIGIETPVAFVVTKGESAIQYDKEYFSSIDVFTDSTGIAVDSHAEQLVYKSFPIGQYSDVFEFDENAFPGVKNNCAVMLSSTMRIQEIKKNNLAGYTWHCAYLDSGANCNYTYEWSLGSRSGNENAAAERLLTWMLGNVYQNDLMISYAQDGQIPINKTCFEEKCNSSEELKPLSKVKDKLVFE